MSYFEEVFIPSRDRVFKRLFTIHPWLLIIRRVILGEKVRFGVNLTNNQKSKLYTLEEEPDGSLTIFEGLDNIDFKVFHIPLHFVIQINEKFLEEWVAKEEMMMKHPLPYFLYYTLKTLTNVRLG